MSEQRKVGHTNHACSRCRKRKIRCVPIIDDSKENMGFRIRCESCLEQGEHCGWDSRVDRVHAGSKKALCDKIASLQSEMHRQKLQYDQLYDHSRLLPGFALPTTAPQSVRIEQLPPVLRNRLVLDPSIGLRRYGALSAFHFRPSTTEDPVTTLTNAWLPPLSPMTNVVGRSIPWSRFLPVDKVPLSEPEHIDLLNLFFDCFAFWGLRCNRNLFQRDMQAALPSTKSYILTHYSPMLHNAILAVASAYSDNPRLKDMGTRMAFAKKAEEYTSEEIRNPTLSGVQAISLLAAFYSGVGMQTAGSVLFGTCASMTQSLGLGVDASEFVRTNAITEQEKQARDWLFWVIFFQDKIGALCLGRDILIPKPHEIRIPEFPQEMRILKSKTDLFKEQINLFLIGTDVFQKVYCTTTCINRDDVRALFNALDSWYKNLPSSMRLPDPVTSAISREKIMLHLTFHWIIFILYYPLYEVPQTPSPVVDWNQEAVTTCDLAADRIVHLFDAYDNLRQIPLMAVYVVFYAGVVFIFQMQRLAENPSQRQAASDMFTKCQSFLNQMALTWDCATHVRNILENLYSQLPVSSPRSSLSTGLAPTQPPLVPEFFSLNSPPPMFGTTDEPALTAAVPTSFCNYSTQLREFGPRSTFLLEDSMRPSLSGAGEMRFDISTLTAEEFHHQTFHPHAFYPQPFLPEQDNMYGLLNASPVQATTSFSSPSGSRAPIQSRFRVSDQFTSHGDSPNPPPMQERGMRRDLFDGWTDSVQGGK